MADFYSFYRMVTLKINKLFLSNQQYIAASLVKMNPLVQKIMHGKEAMWM